ncbi:MAG: 3-deoxy-7-phosphoheptulonate synthase, partial [Armatimonadetes bacterium]|nr:3-deoxy-7-phosphoheptulonate synthase [Armatimonadota bacterium]
MVIVLTPQATERDIEELTENIRARGFSPHVSRGVERTIVGCIGVMDAEKAALSEQFRALPYVEQVIIISKPYKLVGRTFRPEGTVIQVRGVEIGGDRLTIMAGPCTVESEEQLMETAHFVKRMGAHILRGG